MASGNDMRAANETYGAFTAIIKWGAISSVIATAFVIFMISS